MLGGAVSLVVVDQVELHRALAREYASQGQAYRLKPVPRASALSIWARWSLPE